MPRATVGATPDDAENSVSSLSLSMTNSALAGTSMTLLRMSRTSGPTRSKSSVEWMTSVISEIECSSDRRRESRSFRSRTSCWLADEQPLLALRLALHDGRRHHPGEDDPRGPEDEHDGVARRAHRPAGEDMREQVDECGQARDDPGVSPAHERRIHDGHAEHPWVERVLVLARRPD